MTKIRVNHKTTLLATQTRPHTHKSVVSDPMAINILRIHLNGDEKVRRER